MFYFPLLIFLSYFFVHPFCLCDLNAIALTSQLINQSVNLSLIALPSVSCPLFPSLTLTFFLYVRSLLFFSDPAPSHPSLLFLPPLTPLLRSPFFLSPLRLLSSSHLLPVPSLFPYYVHLCLLPFLPSFVFQFLFSVLSIFLWLQFFRFSYILWHLVVPLFFFSLPTHFTSKFPTLVFRFPLCFFFLSYPRLPSNFVSSSSPSSQFHVPFCFLSSFPSKFTLSFSLLSGHSLYLLIYLPLHGFVSRPIFPFIRIFFRNFLPPLAINLSFHLQRLPFLPFSLS